MFELTVDENGSAGNLDLSGDLTIQYAQALKEAFVDAASKVSSLAIKVSDVGRVDLAGMQVLCAAHRSMVQDGKSLTIDGKISESLQTAVKDAGFSGCIDKNNDNSGLWSGESS